VRRVSAQSTPAQAGASTATHAATVQLPDATQPASASPTTKHPPKPLLLLMLLFRLLLRLFDLFAPVQLPSAQNSIQQTNLAHLQLILLLILHQQPQPPQVLQPTTCTFQQQDPTAAAAEDQQLLTASFCSRLYAQHQRASPDEHQH